MDMNYTFLHFDLSEIITLLIYNCKNLTGPLILIMSALAIVVLALVISLYSDLASLCLCRHWDWTLDNAFFVAGFGNHNLHFTIYATILSEKYT